MPESPPSIVLGADDADAPWAADLLKRSQAARAEAERALGIRIPGTIHVASYATRSEFKKDTGFTPVDIAAAAIPDRNEIAVVRPVWRAAAADERQRTIVHEMVHLAIGGAAPVEPPVWLNEGLAMAVSGESGFNDRLRLSVAGAFGVLIPIGDLEDGVMMGGERQALAYAESFAVTEFLLRRSYGGERDMPGAIRKLAAELADARRGRLLNEQLRDPYFRSALERQWIGNHASVWAWISFLTGSAFIWTATSFLFLLAYWRKRRMSRAIRERFDAEEIADDGSPQEWNEPWLIEEEDADDDSR